jgi:hypothetical protein
MYLHLKFLNPKTYYFLGCYQLRLRINIDHSVDWLAWIQNASYKTTLSINRIERQVEG